MNAQKKPIPIRKTPAGVSAHPVEQASEHRALRGLLVAGALATPIWLALYLLLR